MSKPVAREKGFVTDLLTTLQNERYSVHAWWSFIAHSWKHSCEVARNGPTLKRSWLHTTLLLAILSCIVLCVIGMFEGTFVAFRVLPGFVFCMVWQQSDMFWHLGLMKHSQTDRQLPTIGLANIFTALRGLAASLLLGHIVSGVHTPVVLATSIFSFGVITDILDGMVARSTHTQSRFGQIADGEADFCLYVALSIILVQNNILPLWLCIIFIVRFFVPLIAAIVSYFLLARPVRFGSTIWGKYAGLAQCVYFVVLLVPAQLGMIVHVVQLPLLFVTLLLMIIAPITQILVNTKDNVA